MHFLMNARLSMFELCFSAISFFVLSYYKKNKIDFSKKNDRLPEMPY